MSGLEVIGGISAVIAIIDGSVKVWNSARKDVKFSKTFVSVADQLPVLQDTLQTYQDRLDPINATLPVDTRQALLGMIKGCEDKAEKLHTIFKETITDGNDDWYERYRKVARRLGKGSKVEELMMLITKDVQNLVNHYVVKSTGPDLSAKLDEIIAEMRSVEPSLPSDDAISQTFNAYGGPQNVSTGSSTQYNSYNTGSGETHNYGGINGNPVFNFGKK